MLPRNDPRQYDQLSAQWWQADGDFAMLHWLAAARCALIPTPARADAVLVDIGCGGGLNASHIQQYRHIGVDIRHKNLTIASQHEVHPIQADATQIPLRRECADVVIAGEVLEHVADWRAVIRHACRILRPGGTLIIDTIARTAIASLVAVTIGERIPGGAPRGIHDPALFVPPRELVEQCRQNGVSLAVWGVRPAMMAMLRWLWQRRRLRGTQGLATPVPIVSTASTAVLYAGKGVKNA